MSSISPSAPTTSTPTTSKTDSSISSTSVSSFSSNIVAPDSKGNLTASKNAKSSRSPIKSQLPLYSDTDMSSKSDDDTLEGKYPVCSNSDSQQKNIIDQQSSSYQLSPVKLPKLPSSIKKQDAVSKNKKSGETVKFNLPSSRTSSFSTSGDSFQTSFEPPLFFGSIMLGLPNLRFTKAPPSSHHDAEYIKNIPYEAADKAANFESDYGDLSVSTKFLKSVTSKKSKFAKSLNTFLKDNKDLLNNPSLDKDNTIVTFVVEQKAKYYSFLNKCFSKQKMTLPCEDSFWSVNIPKEQPLDSIEEKPVRMRLAKPSNSHARFKVARDSGVYNKIHDKGESAVI